MEIIPYNGRIVIKDLPVPETNGMLVIPDSQRDKPVLAEVVRVHDAEYNTGITEGCIVLYKRHAGIEFSGYKVIDSHDIIAKIENYGKA
jgi:co-chaperonin GroES (HSP10)